MILHHSAREARRKTLRCFQSNSITNPMFFALPCLQKRCNDKLCNAKTLQRQTFATPEHLQRHDFVTILGRAPAGARPGPGLQKYSKSGPAGVPKNDTEMMENPYKTCRFLTFLVISGTPGPRAPGGWSRQNFATPKLCNDKLCNAKTLQRQNICNAKTFATPKLCNI